MSVTLNVTESSNYVMFNEIPRDRMELRLISFEFLNFEKVTVRDLKLIIEPDLEHTFPNTITFNISLIDGDLQVTQDDQEGSHGCNTIDGSQINQVSWHPKLTFKDGSICHLNYEAVFSVSYTFT